MGEHAATELGANLTITVQEQGGYGLGWRYKSISLEVEEEEKKHCFLISEFQACYII